MAEKTLHEEAKALDTMIDNVEPKTEQLQEATSEEHNLTVWKALTTQRRVVFWCVFFAFAAVGWGFDAQVSCL